MSALLVESTQQIAAPGRSPRRAGGTTLDDVLVRAWEGLSSACTVACPSCGGAMAPRRTTDGPGGMLRTRGSCGSCRSELS